MLCEGLILARATEDIPPAGSEDWLLQFGLKNFPHASGGWSPDIDTASPELSISVIMEYLDYRKLFNP